MNEMVLFIVIALLEGGVFAFLIYTTLSKKGGDIRGVTNQIKEKLEEKHKIQAEIKEVLASMIDAEDLRGKVEELLLLADSLKAERGRITITQAELETVEARLRELEEIERELEASGIETKEELKILQKKEKDLNTKNDALKAQINQSMEQLNAILGQIQMTAEMAAQIDAMKVELVQTQERIDTLLLQIEQGNEQYFIIKQRYDALDIEYAQLYEKFSETEAALGAGEKKEQ